MFCHAKISPIELPPVLRFHFFNRDGGKIISSELCNIRHVND